MKINEKIADKISAKNPDSAADKIPEKSSAAEAGFEAAPSFEAELGLDFDFDLLNFDQKGLIPAVVQDVTSGTVLMVAYMNREALQKTLTDRRTWFYSRSRQSLWAKGETSGHVQQVAAIYYDCDADTLLVQVHQIGAACHEGTFSCFTRRLAVMEKPVSPAWAALSWLEELVRERRALMPPDSYTTYLFEKGLDKILKKVGEEATEVVIAAKGGYEEEIIYETADLFYHLLVMLRDRNIELAAVFNELEKRHK